MSAVAQTTHVDVRRVINAPAKDLFEAWLDAEALSQFMEGSKTELSSTATNDPRVGGRFHILMHTPDGTPVPHDGEYVAIEPHSRLVFTWNSPYSGGNSLVTVTFTPQDKGAGTEVRIVHERLPADMVGPHTGGWTEILDKLDGFTSA